MKPCHCGAPQGYAACCQPLHAGTAHAVTAEQLMRSRYSAFCAERTDYLLATLHPSRRRPGEREALERSATQTRWLGLRIVDTVRGAQGDEDGEVEFIAAFEEAGASGTGALHERSRFACEEGRWFYVSGEHENLKPPPDPGRNDPCWCGSGKKFKKCHGKAER